MPNILDLSARLSADIRPFVTSMGSSAQSSRTTFQSIAQVATMYLGARGLLGTLNRANQAAMAFGQSLADASAISTISVKQLGDSLKSLDNVFGSVSKASQSMYRILSSGFSQLDADQLVEFQKAVGVSAKVIRADLYNTADVMTTIANAYQLNIDQIKKLQDWFYITVREGKAQGQDLARTLGLVINSASEAGVSLNELGAAIAVLSRTQSVSQSMIGLNQMLNAFIKPTLQAQAAARKWGIEISATALQEKGLTAILTELNQKVGGNVEALEKMFGNIRAGRAILSLTGKQFHNYLNVVNMYNTEAGSGMKAFEKQIDTVQNAYERLQAQQEKTLIDVGEDWADLRKIVYNTGEALLKAFSDSSGVTRWTLYLYGVNLAVKNIVGTITMLRDSINGTTRSVDKLAASMARAAAHSNKARGLSPIYGPYKDSWSSYNKMYRAMNVMTGFGSGKNTLEIMANRFLHGSIHGFSDKINPNQAIASVMLHPDNPADAAKIRQIAIERITKQYKAHAPAAFDAKGNPTDYYLVHPLTSQNVHHMGGVYHYKPVTMNEAIKYQEKLIKLQSLTQAQELRKTYNDAVKDVNAAKQELENARKLRDLRQAQFRSMPKGERVNTLSKLTSTERLVRMKQHQEIINNTSFSGINNAFKYGGFGFGLQNVASGVGQAIGTAFATVSTAMMGIAIVELAVNFGKKLGEQLKLADKFAEPEVRAADAKRSVAITKMFEISVQKATKAITEYEKQTGKVSKFTYEELASLQNQFRTLQLNNELESMEQAVSSLTGKIVELRNEMDRKPNDLNRDLGQLFGDRRVDSQVVGNFMDYVTKVNALYEKDKIMGDIKTLEGLDGGRFGNRVIKNLSDQDKQRLEKLQNNDWSGFNEDTAKALNELQDIIGDLTLNQLQSLVTNLTKDISSGQYNFEGDYNSDVNGITLSKEVAKLFTNVRIPKHMYANFALGAEERVKQHKYVESVNRLGREYAERINDAEAKIMDAAEQVSLASLADMEPLDENETGTQALLENIKHRKDKAAELKREDDRIAALLKQALEERDGFIDYIHAQTGKPIEQITQDVDRVMESTLVELNKRRDKTRNDYHTLVSNTASRIEKYTKKRGNELAEVVLGMDITDANAMNKNINNMLKKTTGELKNAGLNDKEISDVTDIIQDSLHTAIFKKIKEQVQAEMKSLEAGYNPITTNESDYYKNYSNMASKYLNIIDSYKALGGPQTESFAGLRDMLTLMNTKKLQRAEMAELRSNLALLGNNVSSYDPKSEAGLMYIIDELTSYINELTEKMDKVGYGSEEYTKLMEKRTTAIRQRSGYEQQLGKLLTKADNSEEFNLNKMQLQAKYELGEMSYKSYTTALIELYMGVLDEIEDRLKSNEIGEDIKAKLRAKIPMLQAEISKIESEYIMTTISETLENSLASIELKQAQRRITERQALRGQYRAYGKARKETRKDMLNYFLGEDRVAEDAEKKKKLKDEIETTQSLIEGAIPWSTVIRETEQEMADMKAKGLEGTDDYKALENYLGQAKHADAETKTGKREGLSAYKLRLRKEIETLEQQIKDIDAEQQKELNKALNGSLGDTPKGKELKKKYQELVQRQAEILNEMAEATNAARNQLMGTVQDVINNNLENGRLSNVGMHHAMNLLARLSPRFKFDVGGASLGDVMRNARARYSGSTPDVSKAMTQQRRLSDMMDAYIVSKQYEDAGIGKNVQTIVTIMGKRLPLFLN